MCKMCSSLVQAQLALYASFCLVQAQALCRLCFLQSMHAHIFQSPSFDLAYLIIWATASCATLHGQKHGSSPRTPLPSTPLIVLSRHHCMWKILKCSQALCRFSFMQASALRRRKPCAGSAFLRSLHAPIFQSPSFDLADLIKWATASCATLHGRKHGSSPRTP